MPSHLSEGIVKIELVEIDAGRNEVVRDVLCDVVDHTNAVGSVDITSLLQAPFVVQIGNLIEFLQGWSHSESLMHSESGGLIVRFAVTTTSPLLRVHVHIHSILKENGSRRIPPQSRITIDTGMILQREYKTNALSIFTLFIGVGAD